MEYAVSDYGDFQIHVKDGGSNNRSLVHKVQEIEKKYARKERMAEKGIISGDAAKKLEADKYNDIVKAYVEHVIVGWAGKFKGKKLPEFNKDEAMKFFSERDNEVILADIVDFASQEANFVKEQEDAEIKNSKKS